MHVSSDILVTFFETLRNCYRRSGYFQRFDFIKTGIYATTISRNSGGFFMPYYFQNKDGKHPVILRLRFQADRKDIFTGVYCTKTAWDKTAQRIKPGAKDAPQANQRLERWLIECNEHFNALKYSGKVFFLRDLVQRLKGKEDLPPTIIAYLDHKAKELKMRVGIDITKATLQKYLRCAKYLEEFLRMKYKHDDLNISAITETTINDYFYYLRVVKGNSLTFSAYDISV